MSKVLDDLRDEARTAGAAAKAVLAEACQRRWLSGESRYVSAPPPGAMCAPAELSQEEEARWRPLREEENKLHRMADGLTAGTAEIVSVLRRRAVPAGTVVARLTRDLSTPRGYGRTAADPWRVDDEDFNYAMRTLGLTRGETATRMDAAIREISRLAS